MPQRLERDIIVADVLGFRCLACDGSALFILADVVHIEFAVFKFVFLPFPLQLSQECTSLHIFSGKVLRIFANALVRMAQELFEGLATFSSDDSFDGHVTLEIANGLSVIQLCLAQRSAVPAKMARMATAGKFFVRPKDE